MKMIGTVLAAAMTALLAAPVAASAQDHSGIYSKAELDADAERLETAMRKMYAIGLEPVLTAKEKATLANLQFTFPRPQQDDYILDFYTYEENGKDVVALPLLSLKALEDVTTAYAWLYSKELSLGTIDLYFAMLRRERPTGFAGGRYPAPLPALGVPNDAYKHPPVDGLSLRLRNEAFAFLLGHEIGHIVLGHGSYDDVTPEESRAEEAAADRFALDLLSRTNTPPLGAVLMFQAQAYSLPNRGQFASEQEWRDFLRERSYHPLTPDRLMAMAAYANGPLADQRPAQEQQIWRFIGVQLASIVETLKDRELQDCIARASTVATPDALKPGGTPAEALFQQACL